MTTQTHPQTLRFYGHPIHLAQWRHFVQGAVLIEGGIIEPVTDIPSAPAELCRLDITLPEEAQRAVAPAFQQIMEYLAVQVVG